MRTTQHTTDDTQTTTPATPFAPYGISADPTTEDFWTIPSPTAVPSPDGGWTVLFRWRGSPATLDFESWSPPLPLTRWQDSDCWYATVPMPARLRATYRIRTDDGHHADPLNPVGAGGESSIVATPDAPAQPHWPNIGPDDVLPLPRTRVRWNSHRLGGRRTVRIHPAGGGGPAVLLLDGDDWLHLHPAMTAVDSAVAAGEMPPVTLVFVPAKDRGTELGCRPDLWEAVRDELLPLISQTDTPAELDRITVVGQSLGGLSALYAALEFPDLVSRVACQSGAFWWTPQTADLNSPLDGPAGGTIAARLREKPDLSRLKIAFDLGEHEEHMRSHCETVEELTRRAGATVHVTRSAAGHDRAGWRHALLRDIAWLLT
ncbi:enterochelin esterase [Austwickia chelonae]|uniref:Putative esterase n=1 Tax=Austwickia chelonae NBRC 105200 TaxID=1184607 RepID=K6ULQ9_9MICO|nr:alpha/beta hydrolase-fold protein [Austwickia chelonae]GAB77466.1 putative esterase [Austwickia chelonae NBRC 105200]SEW11013.1 enterochelin esterase [Austwickia chelonae]